MTSRLLPALLLSSAFAVLAGCSTP
ncbi:TPA: YgdI/YgdR family lipoprotein, partial [Pseudomonas aeruginosa]